jgi:hypothetical protein
MTPLHRLFLSILAVFCTSLASAHDPFQNSIEIQPTAECLEVVAILSPLTGGALLNPPSRDPLSEEVYLAQQAGLLAAAAKVCALQDSEGKTIPSSRVHVSFNRQGELEFLFEYPAATRPAALRVDLLSSLDNKYFFEVVDRTSHPPRLLNAVRSRPLCSLQAPPTVPTP